MRYLHILFLFTLLVCFQNPCEAKTEKKVKPVTKSMADSAFVHEDYARAALMYRQLLSKGQSADLYYDIGNCCYRMDSIAKAILNYERALTLNPGDADARFNLDLARSKTVDKVMPAGDMFFVTLYWRIVRSMGINGWIVLAIASFIIMLCTIALYVFGTTVAMKKSGFALAIVLLLVSLFSNAAAYSQKKDISMRTGAIIMSTSVVVKSTPSDSGTDLFILHEGTRVNVIDDVMKDWCEIHVADGKEGWMRKEDLEMI